jgi:hypothetical protein
MAQPRFTLIELLMLIEHQNFVERRMVNINETFCYNRDV